MMQNTETLFQGIKSISVFVNYTIWIPAIMFLITPYQMRDDADLQAWSGAEVGKNINWPNGGIS